jgi:hypothetical protein
MDSTDPAMAAEIEAAQRDKLTIELVAELLIKHRAGCNCARDALIRGLRWLVYADSELERLGCAYEALVIAVGRLRADPSKPRAKGPRIPADEVEAYVAAEIQRSYFDHRREVSSNIRPPASTASDRKRRGEDPGGLKRDWSRSTTLTPEDRDGATWLDNRCTRIERVNMEQALYELREHVARTADELVILDCLEAGMSFRDIAAELGVSKYHVEKTVALFRRRASEL